MGHLTRQDILTGLQPFWVDVLGIDEDQAVVCPDDNLIDWLRSLGQGVYEDLDFADVHYRLCMDVGLEGPLDDLDEYFGDGTENDEQWEQIVKPTLTFGRFADWIAEHTPVPAYDPINITGRPCQPAGTFLAIQQVVQSVDRDAPAFGPSTPILHSLSGGTLARVWSRLCFHSAGVLPKLVWPLERFGFGLALTGFLGGVLSVPALAAIESAWIPLGLAVAVALVVLGCQLTVTGNPLPPNVTTFKDLSNEMTRALRVLRENAMR